MNTNAQNRAPKKIREALLEKHPTAQKIKWTSVGERQKEWTADYWVESDSLRSIYDYKANWITTYTFIEISELPEAVTSAIIDEYMNADIILATRMEEPGFVGYGVAFMYKKDRWGVQITKEGKVVRRRLTSEGFYF